MKETKLYFSIPDSDIIRPFNIFFLKYLYKYKEWFYNDFSIESAFGCPFNCKWTGGVYEATTKDTPIEKFNKIVDMFNSYNIKYRLVLSNKLRTKQDLNDEYTNLLLDKINRINGFVTLTSSDLYQYIQNNYPNIKRCWSCLSSFGETEVEEIDKINSLSKNNTVVIPHYFNNRIFMFNNKQNIEILPNRIGCTDFKCPNMKLHQKIENISAINKQDIKLDFCEYYNIDITDKNFSTEKYKLNHSHIITRENICNYSKQGYSHYKLIDRINLQVTIASYIYYFVKDEYKEMFFDLCCDTLSINNNIKKNILKLLSYFQNK